MTKKETTDRTSNRRTSTTQNASRPAGQRPQNAQRPPNGQRTAQGQRPAQSGQRPPQNGPVSYTHLGVYKGQEKLYQQQAAQGTDSGAAGAAPNDDGVVDADYEVVDDDQ